MPTLSAVLAGLLAINVSAAPSKRALARAQAWREAFSAHFGSAGLTFRVHPAQWGLLATHLDEKKITPAQFRRNPETWLAGPAKIALENTEAVSGWVADLELEPERLATGEADVRAARARSRLASRLLPVELYEQLDGARRRLLRAELQSKTDRAIDESVPDAYITEAVGELRRGAAFASSPSPSRWPFSAAAGTPAPDWVLREDLTAGPAANEPAGDPSVAAAEHRREADRILEELDDTQGWGAEKDALDRLLALGRLTPQRGAYYVSLSLGLIRRLPADVRDGYTYEFLSAISAAYPDRDFQLSLLDALGEQLVRALSDGYMLRKALRAVEEIGAKSPHRPVKAAAAAILLRQAKRPAAGGYRKNLPARAAELVKPDPVPAPAPEWSLRRKLAAALAQSPALLARQAAWAGAYATMLALFGRPLWAVGALVAAYGLFALQAHWWKRPGLATAAAAALMLGAGLLGL